MVATRSLPWVILAALLAGSVTEKLVFQGNPTPHYGFDVDDDPTHDTCPAPYDAEQCILIQRTEFVNDYLGKGLPNDKHAYRVHFQIYANADGAQSKFRCILSFKVAPVTVDLEGDGHHTGAFGESVGAVFEENSVGYDIKLIEVNQESYQEIATGSEPRRSDAWRGYDFIANSDTGNVTLLNDQGDVLAHAVMQHHGGKPIESEWFRGTGGNFYTSNLFLRATGGSPSIYDQDPRPPVISAFAQNPRLVAPQQDVVVSATIRDDWGHAAAVLRWWMNNQPQSDITMTGSGTAYSATIPGQINGAVVKYLVEATAVSGLTARTNTIQYTVGSNTDPKDLGGSGGTSTPGLTEALLVGAALLVLGFILFLALKDGDAKLARILLVSGATTAVLAVLLVLNLESIQEALSSPILLPAIIIVAALVAVTVQQLRRKGVPK